MRTEKIVEELYLSRILNSRIYNRKGKMIGRVNDIAAYPGQTYPRVAGICCSGEGKLIPIDQIAYCGKSKVILADEFFSLVEVKDLSKTIYLNQRVLDKQLIDLKGAKLVRVNDVVLSWIGQEKERKMLVTAVDIGIRGLFRRLGMEFLFQRVKNKLLGWQYITLLEEGAKDLQIGEAGKNLNDLQPTDIAQLFEVLDFKRCLRFMENLQESQISSAIPLIKRKTCRKILQRMEARKAARILSLLPQEKSDWILSILEGGIAKKIRNCSQTSSRS